MTNAEKNKEKKEIMSMMKYKAGLVIVRMLIMGGVVVGLSGCASEDFSNFMNNTLPNINHSLAPAAANSAASRGDYKQANDIMRNDALQQMMRNQ